MSKIYQKTLPVGKNAGFTLIELLVVVLIIGILAAVALPKYELAVEKARAAEPLSVLKSLRDAQEIYYMANGTYTTNLDDLDIEVPESKNFRYVVSGQLSVAVFSNKKPYLLAYRFATSEYASIVCGTTAQSGTSDYEYARKLCGALGADISRNVGFSAGGPRWAIVK